MNQIPDGWYRISVKALVLNETRDKFLVVLEESGRWDFPGGGIHPGEGPQACLRREIENEEMRVPVTWIAENPCYFLMGQFQSEKRCGQWYANVFYEVKLGHLCYTPSDECQGVRFVNSEEAVKLNAFDSVHKLAELFNIENHR